MHSQSNRKLQIYLPFQLSSTQMDANEMTISAWAPMFVKPILHRIRTQILLSLLILTFTICQSSVFGSAKHGKRQEKTENQCENNYTCLF